MVAARVTSYLYSLRTAVFRPEDDELGQLVVGVSSRVIKPACPPDNGVAVVPAAENVFIYSNLLIKVKMSQSIGPIPIVMETHSHELARTSSRRPSTSFWGGSVVERSLGQSLKYSQTSSFFIESSI